MTERVTLKAPIVVPMSDDDIPGRFLVFRFGEIESSKGTFLFDAIAAASCMQEYANAGVELGIDYEHQAVSEIPVAAPAAGWFVPEVDAEGLWASNVRWTEPAAAMLRAREYRYFSPAFLCDSERRIMRLLNIALTNLPAMQGLAPLVAASDNAPCAAPTPETDMGCKPEPKKADGGPEMPEAPESTADKTAELIAEIVKKIMEVVGAPTPQEALSLVAARFSPPPAPAPESPEIVALRAQAASAQAEVVSLKAQAELERTTALCATWLGIPGNPAELAADLIALPASVRPRMEQRLRALSALAERADVVRPCGAGDRIMATSQAGIDITLPVAADYSAKQYHGMDVSSAGKAVLISAAGQRVVGVLQDAPAAAGRAGRIRTIGTTKCVASGALTAGDSVAFDAAGKIKAAVLAATNTSDAGGATDALIGSHVAGILLEDASGDGAIVEVCLCGFGAFPTTAA